MAHLTVYVCTKCAPGWGEPADKHHCPYPKMCSVCAMCDSRPEKFTFRSYRRIDIFYMDKCIEQAESNIEMLQEKIKLLETHIKYAPGGEGALEALYSFTQHLEEPSLDAERPVGHDTDDK